jgi:hypothetical protein
MKPNDNSEVNLKPKPVPKSFLRKHSLGLVALGIVVTLIVAYTRANPSTHWGSFFGNAIADWAGVDDEDPDRSGLEGGIALTAGFIRAHSKSAPNVVCAARAASEKE